MAVFVVGGRDHGVQGGDHLRVGFLGDGGGGTSDRSGPPRARRGVEGGVSDGVEGSSGFRDGEGGSGGELSEFVVVGGDGEPAFAAGFGEVGAGGEDGPVGRVDPFDGEFGDCILYTYRCV